MATQRFIRSIVFLVCVFTVSTVHADWVSMTGFVNQVQVMPDGIIVELDTQPTTHCVLNDGFAISAATHTSEEQRNQMLTVALLGQEIGKPLPVPSVGCAALSMPDAGSW